MSDRINLIVPFSQKDEAKSKGAKWDAKNKTWYVLEGVDLNDFYKWLPDNIPNLRATNYSFAETEIICWKCKKQTLVYSIYLEEYDCLNSEDFWYWDKVEIPTFVSYADQLNEIAAEHVKSISNNYYRLDYSKHMNSSYYLNHCSNCNMKQGDFSVHDDNPGEGFFIVTEDQFKKVKFYKFNEFITLNGTTSIDSFLMDLSQ